LDFFHETLSVFNQVNNLDAKTIVNRWNFALNHRIFNPDNQLPYLTNNGGNANATKD